MAAPAPRSRLRAAGVRSPDPRTPPRRRARHRRSRPHRGPESRGGVRRDIPIRRCPPGTRRRHPCPLPGPGARRPGPPRLCRRPPPSACGHRAASPPPTGVATASPASSAPAAPSSPRANATRRAPDAMPGRSSCCRASGAWASSRRATGPFCVDTDNATLPSPRASSSVAARQADRSSPSPPKGSGMPIPRKPNSASIPRTSSSRRRCSSQPAERGRISPSANSRVISRMDRSSGVMEHHALRSPCPARAHTRNRPQQRRRAAARGRNRYSWK